MPQYNNQYSNYTIELYCSHHGIIMVDVCWWYMTTLLDYIHIIYSLVRSNLKKNGTEPQGFPFRFVIYGPIKKKRNFIS